MSMPRVPVLLCVLLFVLLSAVCPKVGLGAGGEVIAYASSSTKQSPPHFAIDDAGPATAWRTDGELPQWIAVDLGERRKVDRLCWRKGPTPATPRDYDIQITSHDPKRDGKAMWRTIKRVRGSASRCGAVVSFPPTRAQYIRLYIRETHPSLDEKAPSRIAVGEIQVGYVGSDMSPEGLAAEVQEKAVKLTWRPPGLPAEDLLGYNVYRTTNTDDGYRLLNLGGLCTETSYLDERLVPGTTYHYAVSTVGKGGGWESGLSEPVTADAPAFEYPPLGTEQPGVSGCALGRFGTTDYLGHYSATEGLMAFSVAMEWNRQFYLTLPMLQLGDYEPRGLKKAGFPYSPNSAAFGTVRPGGIASRDVAKTKVLRNSWAGMQFEMRYKEARMVVHESLLCPAIAIEVTGKGLRLFDEMNVFGIGGPHGIGYVRGGRPESGVLSKSRIVTPKMGIPWLLVWFGGRKGWEDVDVPWLVTFQNRPDVVRWNGRYIDVSFPEGDCGFITMCPLYGVEKLIDTQEWQQRMPSAAARKCSSLVPYLHAMPVECDESFALDTETGCVKIKHRFTFLNIQDAWETRLVRFSPMPPVVSLAMRSGYPVKTNYETRSMRYDTVFGPLYAAIDTDIIEWEIPAPLALVNRPPAPAEAANPGAQPASSVLPAEELRKRGLGRGEAAYLPFEGIETRWGTMDEAAKTKFAAAVTALFEDLGVFDTSRLRLVSDPLSGKRGYVDSWLSDSYGSRPKQTYNAARFLKAAWAYGEYCKKADAVKSHWDSILVHFDLLCTASDWALNSPLASLDAGMPRRGSAVDLDLCTTLAVYEGLLATARMAKQVGDMETFELAVCMAAKTQALIYFFHKYERYAAGFLPWKAVDGSSPDPAHSYPPVLSGSAGAVSWNAKPETAYPISPDVAWFYTTYLGSDALQIVSAAQASDAQGQ